MLKDGLKHAYNKAADKTKTKTKFNNRNYTL
jgi:hypothetical protein